MRLTEELPMGSYKAKNIYLEPNRNEQECIYKLGQLEDIEEELGIDLITLFKALKNGAWYREEIDDNEYSNAIFELGCNLYLGDHWIAIQDYTECKVIGYYKDYGKTWALTREELL